MLTAPMSMGEMAAKRTEMNRAARAMLAMPIADKRVRLVLQVDLTVNPWQADLLLDNDTFCLVAIGGLNSGKTWALTRWLMLEMMHQAGTGTVGAVFTNTYQQADQNLLPHLWSLLEDELGMQYGRDYVFNERPPRAWANFRSRYRKHNGVISVRQWGQLVVRSMDNPDSIRGLEVGYAAFDEMRDTPKDAWDIAIARVRCPKARRLRIRGATTPRKGWLYKEFVERLPEFDPNERRVIRMRSRDNLFGSETYEDRMRMAYDPKFAQQELDGEFVTLTEGLVYHQFEAQVHMRDDLTADPDINWQVCFDFNRNPFTVVLCQTTGNPDQPMTCQVNVLHVIALTDTDTVAACREVIRVIESMGGANRMIEVFGDASGNTRSTKSNASDYDLITMIFREHWKNRMTRHWRKYNPSVQSRVNAVNAMLRNANGDVRLYVSKGRDPANKKERCDAMRNDFEQVCYVPDKGEINKKGKENRMLTHASDALGYYLVERFPIRHVEGGRMSIDL